MPVKVSDPRLAEPLILRDEFRDLSQAEQQQIVDDIVAEQDMSASQPQPTPDTRDLGGDTLPGSMATAPVSDDTGIDPAYATGFGEHAKQIGSGLAEGLVADTIGLPADLAQLGYNAAVKHGPDIPGIDLQPWTENNYGGEAVAAGMENMGLIADENPNYAFSRKAGRYTGQGLGMLVGGAGLARSAATVGKVAGGGSRLAKTMSGAEKTGQFLSGTGKGQSVAKAVTREVSAGMGAAGGEEAGGYIGEAVAGDEGRAWGQVLGSLGGSFSGPMASAGKNRMLRTLDPESATAYAESAGQVARVNPARQKLNALEEAGVSPTVSNVGGEGATRLSNTIGVLPLVGERLTASKVVASKRLGEGVADMTDSLRPAEMARGGAALDAAELGSTAHRLANDTADVIEDRISDMERLLNESVGGKSGVDIDGVIAKMEADLSKMDAGNADKFEKLIENLKRDRNVPIDVDAHRINGDELKKQKKILKTAKDQLAKTGPNAKATISHLETKIRIAQGEVDNLTQVMSENMGMAWDKLDSWRKGIGRTADADGVTSWAAGDTYGAAKNAQREAAGRLVEGGDETFDVIKDYERTNYNARDADALAGADGGLKELQALSIKEAGSSYNWIKEGMNKSPQRLRSIKDNVKPEEWKAFVADILDNMSTTKPGGQSLDAFDPKIFGGRWNDLSDATRKMMFDDPKDIARMDNLVMATKALAAEGAGPTPTSMTKIMVSLQNMGSAGKIAGGIAVGATMVNSLGAALTGIIGLVGAGGFARWLDSPKSAKALISAIEADRLPQLLKTEAPRTARRAANPVLEEDNAAVR